MALFNKKPQTYPATEREILEAKYKNSVNNLILIVALTILNSLLLVSDSGRYFLFSAFIPYYAVDMGMYCCGYYPAEYYYGDEEFLGTGFFAAMIAVAVAVIGIYVLCWFFAKKKKVGCLFFILAFFAVDTAFYIYNYGFASDMIFDILIRIWVFVSVGNGIKVFYQLKKLPAEIPETPIQEVSE